MEHRVTVGTYRYQIASGIHLIVAANCVQLNDVVYVDETSSQLAVQRFHIDTTYRASSAKVSNALVACTSVSFVSIDEYLSSLPLFEQGAFYVLVCKYGRLVDLVRAKSPIDSDRVFDIEMWHRVSNACKRERCAISNAIEDEDAAFPRSQSID